MLDGIIGDGTTALVDVVDGEIVILNADEHQEIRAEVVAPRVPSVSGDNDPLLPGTDQHENGRGTAGDASRETSK